MSGTQKVEAGGGRVRPTSRRLAPRDRKRQPAPPRPRGAAPGDQGGTAGHPLSPLPLPPPPPRHAGSRRPAGETAAPQPPRRGRSTQGGDATASASAAARQAPPEERPLTPALPAANRRLCAGAVGRNGTAAPRNAQTKRPALVPTLGRRGDRPWRGDPPPCHTNPPAADRAAPGAHGPPATPAERVYPGGVHQRRRGTGTGATGHPPRVGGWGTAARPPFPIPPHPPPPCLRATGAPALHPREAKGTSPLPQKGPRRPGGDAAGPARRAPPRPPPPAPGGVATGGRTRTSAQERRMGHARRRHATTNRSSMGAAPPMTRASPMTPAPLLAQGGQRDGPRQNNPPAPRPPGNPSGGAAHGPPPPPPPGWPAGAGPHPAPGAAPRPRPNAYTWRRGAGDERGTGQRAAGRPPHRGNWGATARPPPCPRTPPADLQATRAPAPSPPRQRG